MRGRRKRIAIIHDSLSTWVQKDIAILSERYEVREQAIPSIWAGRRNVPRNFMNVLRQVAWADLVFCWYADGPTTIAARLAKSLGRKSMASIMGYEVASCPEIGYGGALTARGAARVRKALHSVDVALSVSNATREEAGRNTAAAVEKINTLHHCFSAAGSHGRGLRERIALTVGFVRWNGVRRKGQDTFVRAAAFLPQVPFVLLGDWGDDSIDYLRSIASPNVAFVEVGARGQAAIDEAYSRSQVYVQPSVHEAFGCAVAEAMLWGCVPVVSQACALPEVVGDTGYYADVGDAEGLAQQIELALREGDGQAARQRIVDQFPLEKRRNALLRVVGELLGDG